MLATGMLLHERYSLGWILIHHAIADLVAIGSALCPKPIVIGHDGFPSVIPCTRGMLRAHEHLRGEYKHIKLRASAVDRPRAILVLRVGRAG